MGEGPPEQQAHGQPFNGGEDGGPGGGKAGDGFKKAVHIGPELPGKPEGQRPERPEQDPNEAYGEETLPGEKVCLGLEEKHRHGGRSQHQQDGAQEGDWALPVEQGHPHRDEHSRGLNEQCEAGDAQHQFEIHRPTPS